VLKYVPLQALIKYAMYLIGVDVTASSFFTVLRAQPICPFAVMDMHVWPIQISLCRLVPPFLPLPAALQGRWREEENHPYYTLVDNMQTGQHSFPARRATMLHGTGIQHTSQSHSHPTPDPATASVPLDPSSPPSTRISTSLPPLVRGARRGALTLCIDEVVWFPSSSRSRRGSLSGQGQGQGAGASISSLAAPHSLKGSVLARLAWWGEQGAGTVWMPPQSAVNAQGERTGPIAPGIVQNHARPTGLVAAVQEYASPPLSTALAAPAVQFPIVVSPQTFINYLRDAQWIGQSLDTACIIWT